MDKKTLKEITDMEWVVYEWIEVTTGGDTERKFIRGRERTPDEAATAQHDWDIWFSAAKAMRKSFTITANI